MYHRYDFLGSLLEVVEYLVCFQSSDRSRYVIILFCVIPRYLLELSLSFLLISIVSTSNGVYNFFPAVVFVSELSGNCFGPLCPTILLSFTAKYTYYHYEFAFSYRTRPPRVSRDNLSRCYRFPETIGKRNQSVLLPCEPCELI